MAKKGKGKGKERKGLDSVLVPVAGDAVCAEPHPGTEGFPPRFIQLETRPGDTAFIQKRGREVAGDTGQQHARELCLALP